MRAPAACRPPRVTCRQRTRSRTGSVSVGDLPRNKTLTVPTATKLLSSSVVVAAASSEDTAVASSGVHERQQPPAWRRVVATVAASCYLAGAAAAFPPIASADFFEELQLPSIMGLKLKPRTQEAGAYTRSHSRPT